MSKNISFFSIIKKLFIVLYIMSVSVILYNQYGFYIKEKHIKKSLIEKIKIEEEKQKKIKKELNNNLSDKYIENIAREKLGLIKSDEIIFIDR